MNLKFLSILAIALVTAPTSVFASPVVLSNPYDVNSTAQLASVIVGGRLAWAGFSDFHYDGSYEITDFHWTGSTFSNDFSDINGFWFSIHSSNAGRPVPPVYSQFVAGNANATENGDRLMNSSVMYDFSLDLTSPWTAPIGDYYFSVVADVGSWNRFYWGLSQSQYGADDFFFTPSLNLYTELHPEGDLAWEVTGNRLGVVPEPATMTLFGLGLLGSALAARRSKKKNQTDV